MINFVLSVKLWVKMHFLPDPVKAYIFYPNRFLYVLSKKPRNEHLHVTHDYYFVNKTFFSQMNDKRFFLVIHPLKYLGSQVAADGGCERDVVHRMKEGYRAWGALKSVLSTRGLGIKAKKCLYEGVIIPTALYGAEAWGMRSVEIRKGMFLR